MEEQEEGTESEFNMSEEVLKRINQLMGGCVEFMGTKQLVKTFDMQKIIADEINFVLEDHESKALDDMEKEIQDLFDAFKENIDATYSVAGSGTISYFFQFPDERKPIEEKLRLFYRKLRLHSQQKGLLIKEKRDFTEGGE